MTQRLIIAGGGLSGVLSAMAFLRARPDIELTVLEGGPTLGGDHTWSFYDTDLDADSAALVEPFVAHRWDGYDTRFQKFVRTFSTAYCSVTSAKLHDVALAALGDRVRLNASVAAVDAAGVTLEGGERLEADAVIDARGARRLDGVVLRWQKFLGREVRLAKPHGLTRPTIMDATVSQIDGYRFVYLLPFSAETLLIEDTYYTDGAEVDRQALHKRIDEYAAQRGWSIVEDIRQEKGSLPLLLSGDFKTMWRGAAPQGGGVPIGLRAGLFHPITGYSLPASSRTAVALAKITGPLTTRRVMETVEDMARRHFRRTWYDRMLNRQLFLAGKPEHRHRIMSRFHKLPQPLIERFYAGRLPPAYQLRILFGKPPVPIMGAMKALPERAALQAR